MLCVGTELLLGQIYDTNSTCISEQLADAGISCYEKRTVGDNPERIAHAVTSMLETSDALIITGGLGPTHDDITREVVADVMGVDLLVDDDVVTNMKEIFAKRNREMTDNNLRQAMVPVGATLLRNPQGTAPGLKCPVTINGKTKNVFLTPGVPHEMKYMVSEYIIPELKKDAGENAIVTRTIKTWGLSESGLAETLDPYVQQGVEGDVKVGFLARGINGIYVKLSAKAATQETALAKITPVETEIVSLLSDAVYGYDDQSMESIVIDLLRTKNATLSVAESLTGGLVMSRLVSIPGASDVLVGGVVSYTNQIKSDILGVTASDVYSHECAQQMAAGVQKECGSNFALSTTGVAGPGADGIHQPGEVFIGIADTHNVVSERFLLGGDRERVREYATISALNLLRWVLLGHQIDNNSSE